MQVSWGCQDGLVRLGMNLIPGTHKEEGEKQLHKVIL